MKYQKVLMAYLCVAGLFSAYGATLNGRVVDSNTPAKPIANATVSLKSYDSAMYTDVKGQFTITPTGIAQVAKQSKTTMQLAGQRFSFSCAHRELVFVDMFDVRGQKVSSLVNKAFEAGSYDIDILSKIPATLTTGFYLVKIRKGNENLICSFVSTGNKRSLSVDKANTSIISTARYLSKASTTSDSLIVYRMGYVPKAIAITSASSDLGDIVLSKTAAEIAIDRKIDSLLAKMSDKQKAGQMVQAQINIVTDAQIAAGGYGSVFNGGEEPVSPNTPTAWANRVDQIQNAVMGSGLKIPMLYGIDAVHGNAKVIGSTIFPHNIALGATNDTALVSQMARVTAAECAAVGIRLTFATAVSVVRNEHWGRTYEGYGETPEINSKMGLAYTRGLQGDGDLSKQGAIAACVKHYLGDGGTTNGVNGGTVSATDATMRAVHLPPYAACARENMASVMPSYNAWAHDGKDWRQSVDSYTMTTILKKELGFDGFCLSDYNAIPQVCGVGGSSTDYNASCVAQSINAGMDMAMIAGDNGLCTQYVNSILSGISSKAIDTSRINDAVRRILRIKFRLGLFDHPLSDATLRSKIFSTESQLVARKCVRQSLVLLKNDASALPLKKTEKVVVVGPWASNMGDQCGGWTIGWQGAGSDSVAVYSTVAGQTILAGLKTVGGANVTYDSLGKNLSSSNPDKIVVVVGEKPYAEGAGDKTSLDFSSLPHASLIQTCFNTGKPVILVMITGRPMIIDTEKDWCKAMVAAWLPGSEGIGIADVLFGDVNFTGKLTHTWPASNAQIPINAGPTYADEQHGTGGTALYPYGHGLTY